MPHVINIWPSVGQIDCKHASCRDHFKTASASFLLNSLWHKQHIKRLCIIHALHSNHFTDPKPIQQVKLVRLVLSFSSDWHHNNILFFSGTSSFKLFQQKTTIRKLQSSHLCLVENLAQSSTYFIFDGRQQRRSVHLLRDGCIAACSHLSSRRPYRCVQRV